MYPRSYTFFFFQAEDGIRDKLVTGVQTCALPICMGQRGAGPVRRAMSGPVLAGGVLALVLIALGATSLVGLAIQRTERSTRTWAGVSALEVDVDSGDVEVVAASRDD